VRLRPKFVTLLAALVAGALTDLVILVPSLQFAYRSVPLHAMLETAATLIGVLTAFLLWGRLRQRHRLDDLLLFIAIGVLAFTNLVFAAVPAAFSSRPHPFSTWTTIAGSVLATALLAVAAAAPRRRLRDVSRATWWAAGVAGVMLAVSASVVAALAGHLPIGLDPAQTPLRDNRWIAGSSTLIVVTQLLIAGLFVVAAVGFTRRAEGEADELLLWLGAAAAVGAMARINYFAFPSLHSDWVYTGDAFRLMWQVLLFVGAARELQAYQRAFAEARVVEERRRIARELHDGLAQELAFIANAAQDIVAETADHAKLWQVASAAQRGLDESRRAIVALSRESDEPFDVALIQAVEEVAGRVGARVKIVTEPLRVEPHVQEQLLRIVREAVTNAGRHAAADVVHVQCTNGAAIRIRIEDDGVGFDPEDANPFGFGLTTMRERATDIGGDLQVVSKLGKGTVVEVCV
jgi:signal transduction histidine kinase